MSHKSTEFGDNKNRKFSDAFARNGLFSKFLVKITSPASESFIHWFDTCLVSAEEIGSIVPAFFPLPLPDVLLTVVVLAPLSSTRTIQEYLLMPSVHIVRTL